MVARIAIYPGTFDPVTRGHLDIIERASRIVDRLIVGVAENAGKSPLFTVDERLALLKNDAGHIARVEILPFSNLLIDFARAQGAQIIVRGLRAASDFEFEFQMAGMNHLLAPDLETVFLTASDTVQFISSKLVKEIAALRGDVSPFVSPLVAQRLQEKQ